MRRLLISAWHRIRRQTGEIERQWDNFWFVPADPTLLGLIRVCTGLMLVYTHLVWGLQLEAFFGPDAWLTPELVETMQRDQIVWSYWWYVPTDMLWTAHYVSIAILTLFTLGVATRVTSILSFVVVISYINRTPCALYGLDQVNGFLTFYCCLGPAGDAVSMDRLMRRWWAGSTSDPSLLKPQPSVGANIALRLIQVQMCVIYFFAGISKLLGAAWWTGDAMWLAFSNLEYQSNDMTWLVHYPWITQLMTHTTVAWELTFWSLIWKPMCRPFVLTMAVLLHVGIGACLGMWTFGLIMLVGCMSFLPPSFAIGLVDSVAAMVRACIPRVGSARKADAPTWTGIAAGMDATAATLDVGAEGPLSKSH